MGKTDAPIRLSHDAIITNSKTKDMFDNMIWSNWKDMHVVKSCHLLGIEPGASCLNCLCSDYWATTTTILHSVA